MGFPKKPEEEKYKRMNITLPPDLNERLEEYCKKDGRKKSSSLFSTHPSIEDRVEAIKNLK